MSLRDAYKAIDEGAKRQELMKKIESDSAQYGQNHMEKIRSCNIMIIGRTRSGKSTIKSLLLDATKVPDELTLKSGTRDPHIESFYIKDMHTSLNIIDTPGLFERGSEENSTRDNDTILKTIEKCANMEITSFNVICFCAAITAGINGDDVKSIELFIQFLGNEMSDNSCLIITHCESKSEEQRQMIKKELQEDQFFKQIAPFFKLGVFFSGSINRDNYNNGNECILNEYVIICEYRTQLIKLFTSNIKAFPITEGKISQLRRANEDKAIMSNELQNEKNKIKEQEQTIHDLLTNAPKQQQQPIESLQKQCKDLERTIHDLRNAAREQERTIRDLQKAAKEQDRTIHDLRNAAREQERTIHDLGNAAKEQKCIIRDLLVNSDHQMITLMEQRYREYFSQNTDILPQLPDNRNRYFTSRYT